MSIFDMFENPDYLKSRDAFAEDLLAIEEKYKYWFEAREPLFETDKHDQLHNHYMIYKNAHQIQFMFHNDNPLPHEIVAECLTAFKNRFGES